MRQEIQLWYQPPPRREIGPGWWLLTALAAFLAALALSGCGVKKGDAASALDSLRQLEWSLCEERPPAPEDEAACARAYASLRVLEPAIEDQLSKGAAMRAAWGAVRPYAWQVARQAVVMFIPWLVPLLPGGVA